MSAQRIVQTCRPLFVILLILGIIFLLLYFLYLKTIVSVPSTPTGSTGTNVVGKMLIGKCQNSLNPPSYICNYNYIYNTPDFLYTDTVAMTSVNKNPYIFYLNGAAKTFSQPPDYAPLTIQTDGTVTWAPSTVFDAFTKSLIVEEDGTVSWAPETLLDPSTKSSSSAFVSTTGSTGTTVVTVKNSVWLWIAIVCFALALIFLLIWLAERKKSIREYDDLFKKRDLERIRGNNFSSSPFYSPSVADSVSGFQPQFSP